MKLQTDSLGRILGCIIGLLGLVAQPSIAGLVVGDTPVQNNPQIFLGMPRSLSDTTVVISRRQYVVSWDYLRKTPDWSAWTLTKKNLGDIERSNTFRLDRDLEGALVEQNRRSVGPSDYKSSCLDRGHQVPSGDRTASEVDNMSTFFMSNIMPQSAYLNRRTWVSLERFLRRQVEDGKFKMQIYAGVVPDERGRAIGPEHDILVPLKNFKVVVIVPNRSGQPDRSSMRLLVVNFPNLTSRGTSPVVDHEQACQDSKHTVRLDDGNRASYWRPFLSTLDQVEKESGLDFSFLNGVREMTPSEVDQWIHADKDVWNSHF